MSLILALAIREYRAFFRLGIGWAVISLFLLLSGFVFAIGAIRPGEPATMRFFFAQCIVLLLPMAPAISMRLFSEEFRQGTIETLMTAPIGEVAIALSKFLGALLFLLTMLAPTLAYPVLLTLASSPRPDPGPILAGYTCIVLLGSLYLAAGMLASALTSSQTLAFLASLLALVGLVVGMGELADRLGGAPGEIAAALSPTRWVRDFARGIIDLSHLIAFLAVTAWLLTLSIAALDARRWWGGGLRGRTARRAAASGGGVALISCIAVLAGVVAANLHRAGIRTRIDVTRTGELRLAETTGRLLKSLDGGYQVLIAGDLSTRDPYEVERLRDVLDEMGREGLRSRLMNTAAPSGSAEFVRAIDDLAARERPANEARRAALTSEIARARALAKGLASLAPSFLGVRDALDESIDEAARNRPYFEDREARLRLAAGGIESGADAADRELARTIAGLASVDGASEQLRRPLQGIAEGLAAMAEDLQRFAGAEAIPGGARDRASALIAPIRALRDDAARLQAEVEDARRSDFLRIATLLETTEAAVLVGPPDGDRLTIGALPLDDLLGARAGRGAEEVLTAALAMLSQGSPPIVVLAHAHWEPVLGSGIFAAAAERLALRGIDIVEWPVALRAEPVDLDHLLRKDPARPIVYIFHATDGAARGPTGPDGPERVDRYGRALASVLARGDPALISITPSLAATFGGADAATAPLVALGVTADSARPIYRDEVKDGRRQVSTHLVALPGPGDHPISRAIAHLPTIFFGPVALWGEGLRPLCTVEDPRAWAESDWSEYWRTPEEQRAGLARPPEPAGDRDNIARPFVIAAAVERAHPHRAGDRSRAVVVGTNAWFSDPVARAAMLVDGRAAPAYPGNMELFEASVLWLAGQDDLIARTPAVSSIAMVRPLGAGAVRTIVLSLGLGPPALVLLLGLALRLLRP